MKAIAVVGAQWGDEGKGKVVDYMAASFDWAARYAGGHNAGHTVIAGGHKFVLQLIPCGILRQGKKAMIGPGVVVDPEALVAEMECLEKGGVDVRGRLFVSNRAHVIFPFHRQMDIASEVSRGAEKIGTTSRGIGPAYEDKMARRGIRMGDLVDERRFREKLKVLLCERERVLQGSYGVELAADGLEEKYLELAERVRGFVTDTSEMLNRSLEAGASILYEGAQGTMLDIDHGTYPFVTSSSATAGGACTGLGVAPKCVTGVVGVTKAYTTRVGSGPFPTEMPDLEAGQVRDRGKEYGAVTGRPRRCGWLDLGVLRYAKMVNGIDSLVVTKLDVFDAQPEIQVCVGYLHKGRRLTEMPADIETLAEVTPEYRTLPGWLKPTDIVREEKDLPHEAKNYLRFVADSLELEVGMISTGPEREATIVPEGTKLAAWLA